MRVRKRYMLQAKAVRKLVDEVPSYLGNVLKKKRVEIFTLEGNIVLYLVEGEALFVKIDDEHIPTLNALHNQTILLPEVVVDMGAVPFVTNGATIMAPGITSVSGTLQVGDLAVIVDERNHKPLSVGRMIQTPRDILTKRKGRAVDNLHYIGDRLWKYIKKLAQ